MDLRKFQITLPVFGNELTMRNEGEKCVEDVVKLIWETLTFKAQTEEVVTAGKSQV